MTRTAEPGEVTAATLRAWPLPSPGSDKESRGRALVVGGSSETPGAVLLAGEAALRTGAGKLQLMTVAEVVPALGAAVPEARVTGLPATADGNPAPDPRDRLVTQAREADVVLLGPGLSTTGDAAALLRHVVPRVESATVVVDALGSAYLTQEPDGLHHLRGRAVVSVNPTELSRTLREDEDAVTSDMPGATKRLAARLDAVVLCGGAGKVVAVPEGKCWQITGGGPGLGVSGSGDVQAGIVTGLLARGAEPVQAAVWAAFLHARAGERMARQVGEVGFLARELLPLLPALLRELR